MTMDEVMGKMNLPNPETDSRRMRGPAEFDELEYENVTAENGRRADIKFFFAGNALVAFCTDYQDGTDYEAVKADLVGLYGAAVPFSAEKLGNARFLIDDDGELDDCREMIEAEGLLIVLERDDDGDVDVTCLDTTAPYINN